MPRIIPREEWGASYGDGGKGQWTRDEVIIHTEAGATLPASGLTVEAFKAKVRAIERVAIARGFGGISYTFLIDPLAGHIAEGRGWGQNGAHTIGHNRDGHAFCYVGHGDKQGVGSLGWASATWLIRQGMDIEAIAPRYRLSGHRDNLGSGTPAGVGRRLAYKSCPGDKIYPEIGRLRGLTLTNQPAKEWDEVASQDEIREVVRDEIHRALNTNANSVAIGGHHYPIANDVAGMAINAKGAKELAKEILAKLSA